MKPEPKQHPLLLRGPLVREFLAGRKTITRRTDLKKWRRAKPGDLIWFRETWAPHPVDGGDPPQFVIYRADMKMGDCGHFPPKVTSDPGWQIKRWRPSLFMPKWAARCWAEIEEIREEPLQQITVEDAYREGVADCDEFGHDDCFYGGSGHRCSFSRLWDTINGKKPGMSWAENPTVARIQFRRIER
jgi:hypothetical protein